MDNNIGNKIRDMRIKNALTQKQLASKLYVTPQAVSRWENDGIEPPIDALKKMAVIFNVSLDELLSFEAPKQEEKKEEKEEEQVQLVTPAKVFYGTCDRCGKPFKDENDIHNHSEYIRGPRGAKGHHKPGHTEVHKYCTDCENLCKAAEKRREESHRKNISESAEKRRKRALFLSIPLALLLAGLVALIIYFNHPSPNKAVALYCGICIPTALIGYPFFGCLFLNNNPIIHIIYAIVSTLCFKAPGVIFSASLDGLKFLIVIKIIFAIITFLFGVAALALSVVVGGVASIFIFPFALLKNKNHPEETNF